MREIYYEKVGLYGVKNIRPMCPKRPKIRMVTAVGAAPHPAGRISDYCRK